MGRFVKCLVFKSFNVNRETDLVIYLKELKKNEGAHVRLTTHLSFWLEPALSTNKETFSVIKTCKNLPILSG